MKTALVYRPWHSTAFKRAYAPNQEPDAASLFPRARFMKAHSEKYSTLDFSTMKASREKTRKEPDALWCGDSIYHFKTNGVEQVRRIQVQDMDRIDYLDNEIKRLAAVREQLVEAAYKRGMPVTYEQMKEQAETV